MRYCIDYMERGCTSWRHRVETDSNFDATKSTHTHTVCELLKDSTAVPSSDPFYTSGSGLLRSGHGFSVNLLET